MVGAHTLLFLLLVVGAVVADQTVSSVAGWALLAASLCEVLSRLTMEMFQVATIRDWIIEVSDNDRDMLVTSNTWYYILAVTIPGLMTLGGNHLFDMGLNITGIVLTLGCSAILIQLLSLSGIIFIIGPHRNNLAPHPLKKPHLAPLANLVYFFRQPTWELSMGLCVESMGLISFGLFMRLFLAQKGVTPYTISVVMFLQAAAAVLAAVCFPALHRRSNPGYVITVVTLGKILCSAVFLFVVFRASYSASFAEEVVVITHDSIFIQLEDYHPEDTAAMTTVIMVSSVLLAVFSQLDTLFSNQTIQEHLPTAGRGNYAGTEFSIKYLCTLAKQLLIATLSLQALFLTMLVVTFVCEIIKLFLSIRYVLKSRDGPSSYMNELKNEQRGLMRSTS